MEDINHSKDFYHIHKAYKGNNIALRKHKAKKASKTFKSIDDAIKYADEHKYNYYIHDKTGKIVSSHIWTFQ